MKACLLPQVISSHVPRIDSAYLRVGTTISRRFRRSFSSLLFLRRFSYSLSLLSRPWRRVQRGGIGWLRRLILRGGGTFLSWHAVSIRTLNNQRILTRLKSCLMVTDIPDLQNWIAGKVFGNLDVRSFLRCSGKKRKRKES